MSGTEIQQIVPPRRGYGGPPRGPAAGRTSIRRVGNEVMAILASHAPALAERMCRVALETTDERVLAVVGDKVIGYVAGTASERARMGGEGSVSALDTSHLTPEETAEALHCCERIIHFQALIEQRRAASAGGPVVEG